ncbi:MAG: IS110 family transposase [Rhodomicrobium sp.]
MGEISIIGLDLAKHVFQVHAADARGRCVLRKQLKRCEVLSFFAKLAPCVVAMEACGTAHYWARGIAKLGHETRLIPPAYAKAYVKRGKNDAIDAEAICEAAGRPSMRFVPVKTMENQAVAMLHRSRDLLIKNRTMLVNALRSHLAEFGFVAGKGIGKLPDLIEIVSEAPKEALPDMVRAALSGFLDAIALINAKLAALEKQLMAWHKTNAQSKRLDTAPGIGLMGATAFCALVPDPSLFKNGRHLAAWLGIVPRLDGTGGKTRLMRISKAGDGYLRRLLVLGATSLLRSLKNKTTPLALWAQGLLARRSRRAVTVALANKLARIVWAIMAKGEAYKPLAAAQIPAQAVSA